MSTAKAMTPDRLEQLQALFSDSQWFKADEGQELLDEIERAWGEIERLTAELAARAPADASLEARPRSRPYVAEQRQRDRSPVYAEFEKMGQLESDVIEWLSANYEPLKRRALEASRAARAPRGETGPAAEPTRAERVAEAQRLRAEARAEAEACAVPMPADLLARYPRSADPPEPDRPSGLTSIMHDDAPPSVLPKHGGPEL